MEIKAKLSGYAPDNIFEELRDSALKRINLQVTKIEPKKIFIWCGYACQ